MNLGEIRQKYPQYDDLSDQELADSFYQRFYSDMDRSEFDRQIGLAQPEQSPNLLEYLDYGIRNIADAATFGLADRAGAYVNPRINRMLGLTEEVPEYGEALRQERERTQAAPAIVKYPGQVAGGVGTALLAAPAFAATAAKAGLTSLPLMAQMAGVGALEGALHGAGHAQPGQEVQEAVKGAAIGAPLGAAARVVTGGVSGLVNRLNSALRGKAGVGSRAARDLGRAIRRDEMTPDQLTAAARRMATDRPGTATLADVGGENVKGLVERVAQTPGAGRTQVVPALTSKQQQQALRIGKDLSALAGTQRTAFQATQETIQARAAAAQPLYRAAYGAGDRQIWTPELERIAGAPFVGTAAQRAMGTWRNNAIADGFGAMNPTVRGGAQGLVRLGGKGPPVFPNLQFWDYTKRALDDMTRAAKRAGQNEKYRTLTRLTQQLRSELDNAVPDYAAARNAWSGPTAYLEAIEAGRDVFNRKISPEEFRAGFNALTDAEKEGFRTGVVNSVLARMGNDPAKLGDMTKYLRSPAMRDKIAAIMPDEELAQSWARRLEFEVQASELTGRALANSATARRLAEQEASKEIVSDLVIDALSGGSNVSFLRRVLMGGPKWFKDTIRSKTDAQLADILTNPARMNDLDQILGRAAIRTTPTSPALAGAVAAGTVAPLTPNPPMPPPEQENRQNSPQNVLPASPIQFKPPPEGQPPDMSWAIPEAPRDQEMTPEVMQNLLRQFMERGWITPDSMRRLETEQRI